MNRGPIGSPITVALHIELLQEADDWRSSGGIGFGDMTVEEIEYRRQKKLRKVASCNPGTLGCTLSSSEHHHWMLTDWCLWPLKCLVIIKLAWLIGFIQLAQLLP